MATLREQVGALIRHHRDRAKLTQFDLAEKVGVAPETISRIERGAVAPGFDTLSDLARVLSVDVRDFFEAGSFVARADRSDPLVRIVDRVAALDDEDLEWVERLLGVALSRSKR